MTMNRFAHANGTSVKEVVRILDEDCRPLAGGTDLLGLIKEGLTAPGKLVSLKTIPELNGVREEEDGWHIGATTRLSRLAAHPSISQQQDLACLHEAITHTASPQLRHMATIAGSLVQAPRCWYYRNNLVPCWRKGGQHCYAFRGENKYHTILGRGPCHAVHPSDPAVALMALDASVVVMGPSGQRTISLSDFFRLPTQDNRQDNVLAPNELITEVSIPRPSAGSRGTYAKVAERESWDFALVSAAVQLTFSGATVSEAHVVLGGVASVPWRAPEVEEELAGSPLSPEVIERAAQAATAAAQPLEHNGYKVEMSRGAVRQALRKLA